MNNIKDEVILIGQRVEKARDHQGLSQTELARQLGISQTAISYVEKGRNDSPSKYLPDIARLLGVSFRWLRYGEGEMLDQWEVALDKGKGKLDELLSTVPPSEEEPAITIPEVEIAASLDHGNHVNSTETVVDKWPIGPKLLYREGIEPENAVLVRCKGESMHDTISDGDLVVVDKRAAGPPWDGIYAIESDNGIRIKRINMKLDNTVEIISDNENKEKYPTETYSAEVADSLLKVIGRVVRKYWGRVT